MAFNVFADPKLLSAKEEWITLEDDDGNLEDISKERLKEAFENYENILQFFYDLDEGIFRLSYDDYIKLPAVTLQMYRQYRHMIKEFKEKR